jgi:hypothetical protein
MGSLYQESAWDCHPDYMLKVMVTVSKNRNSIFAQLLEFALAF